MADPTFDQLAATTLAELRDSILYDNFFADTPFLRKLRSMGATEEFLGGLFMQTPFMYDRVNGGAYAPGSDVQVEQKQLVAATAFVPKAYKEDVPLNLWQTNVIQGGGPAVKIKLIDMYMQNAVSALNTDIAIDVYRHGQSITGSNRSLFVNGMSEAFNDGINPSWDGNVFPSYGGQTRNGAIANVLNSVPIWAGTSSGQTGQTTYKVLLEAYRNCVQEPDLGLGNRAVIAYLDERQETKQRYSSSMDVTIGMEGLKIKNAYVFQDNLCPSTKFGQIFPAGLSQSTAIKPTTFTTPTFSGTQNAISGYPSNTLVNPGEPFFWIRTKGWRLRPADDPEYNGNFTPPTRSQNNPDLVVSFLKMALNLYTVSPRDNSQVVGFGF